MSIFKRLPKIPCERISTEVEQRPDYNHQTYAEYAAIVSQGQSKRHDVQPACA